MTEDLRPQSQRETLEQLIAEAEANLALQRARAISLVICVCVVMLCPLLFIVLQYLAAVKGVNLVLDERILLACLSAIGVVVVFGFKKKE